MERRERLNGADQTVEIKNAERRKKSILGVVIVQTNGEGKENFTMENEMNERYRKN